MDNKMKMFGVILTIIAILGCVTPTDETGTGATNIVLSIDDPNVGQGHQVAVTALLTNRVPFKNRYSELDIRAETRCCIVSISLRVFIRCIALLFIINLQA